MPDNLLQYSDAAGLTVMCFESLKLKTMQQWQSARQVSSALDITKKTFDFKITRGYNK